MSTFKNLMKCVVGYTFSKITIKTFFCVVYYYYGLKDSYSFKSMVGLLLYGDSSLQAAISTLVPFLLYIQEVLDFVCDSIGAGYMFAYILNRVPRIIMPEKLVIRHRTSENVNGLLSLGVLIGNKSKYSLHSVRCIVSCAYVKKEAPLYINGEFQLVSEIQQLHNYYRFSFDLEKFPTKFLIDYLKKENRPICRQHDRITITLTGNSNNIGNTFMVTKKYYLDDIICDEHIPDLTHIVESPVKHKELFRIIKWNNLNRYYESAKDTRKTCLELREIIKKRNIK